MNQKIMRKLLSRDGHSITMVDDGLQAVQKFEQQGFDVCLIDIHMPVLDGVEACQRMREIERTRTVRGSSSSILRYPFLDSSLLPRERSEPSLPLPLLQTPSHVPLPLLHAPLRVPIIAVTASGLLEDQKSCVKAGMDDVLVKPITPQGLRAKLKPIARRKAADEQHNLEERHRHSDSESRSEQ